PKTFELKNQIVGNKTSMETFWYEEGGTNNCLITQYIDNLDWYIVVQKDTTRTAQILASQINRDLLFIGIIIALVLLMISYVIAGYNRMLLKTARMDDVTNLPNAKMFEEIFGRNLKRPACRQGVVFLFDIDHFKVINDRFGHLFGNTVLYKISQLSKNSIGNKGVVARWGGDEFVGVIYGSVEYAEELLEQLIRDVATIEEDALKGVHISLGATSIADTRNFENLLREADLAMYQSKENGGNQMTFFTDGKYSSHSKSDLCGK
ncbi:MAG: GGDEF domain-containing protein, partial [Anaerovorax sp.]